MVARSPPRASRERRSVSPDLSCASWPDQPSCRDERKPAVTKRRPRASAALRLHGSIARDLGVAIVSGRYRPGDILGGEVESSEELRVSRTAYREAVRILSAKGLVESRPR